MWCNLSRPQPNPIQHLWDELETPETHYVYYNFATNYNCFALCFVIICSGVGVFHPLFSTCLICCSGLWQLKQWEEWTCLNKVPRGWQLYHILISENIPKHPNARGGFIQESVQFVLKNKSLMKALTFG